METARNLLNCENAAHEEIDPSAAVLFITRLECSLYGRALKISFGNQEQLCSYVIGGSPFYRTILLQLWVNPLTLKS